MQYKELSEIEAGEKTPQKHDRKWEWAAFILCAVLFTVAVIGVVTFLSTGSTKDLAVTTDTTPTEVETQPAPPTLTQPQMCGTCQEVPGVKDYTLCATCWVPIQDPVQLHCRSGERPVIEEVKLGGGRELPENAVHLAYTSCLASAVDDGERFTCSYSLASIRDQSDLLFEDSPWPWKSIFGHPRNHVQTKYVCLKSPKAAVSPLVLASVQFPEEESFPLLSATEAKCGKVKPIYEGWDKGAACASTPGDSQVSISCAQGAETRLLVAKVKIHSAAAAPTRLMKHGGQEKTHSGKHHKDKNNGESGNHHGKNSSGKSDKEMQKKLANRAVKLCDGVFETSSKCSFRIEDLYKSGETVAQGDYQFSYVCSYPTLVVV